MTKRDIEYNVPLRLPIPGEDTEAMFRRLVAFSYAIGRQYRADGGVAEIDDAIRAAQSVGDQRAMSHMEGGPGVIEKQDVKVREPLSGYEMTVGRFPKQTAPAIEGALQTASEVAPYFTPAAPIAAARDIAVGLREGNMEDLAMSALGIPGKIGRAAKAAAAGAYALAPEKAEAGTIIKALNAIRSYHGSPHIFERFDSGKIGTGIGAQAYGHGLYFSDNPNVARGYRHTNEPVMIGDKPISSLYKEIERKAENVPINDADKYYNRLAVIEHLMDKGDLLAVRNANERHVFEPEAYDWFRSKVEPNVKTPGGLYEVRINSDPGKFIDLYDQLSKSDPLRDRVASLAERAIKEEDFHPLFEKGQEAMKAVRNPYATGSDMQKFIEDMLGYKNNPIREYIGISHDLKAPEAVSRYLQGEGYAGFTYPHGTDHLGEERLNRVVFDPDTVDIIHRYAQGGEVDREGYEKGGAAVSLAKALLSLHNIRSHRLDMAEKLGGLPVPSIAIKDPEHGFKSFGDITLVGGKELATPSKTNPVFASDVYSPRFPSLDDSGEKIFRGFSPSGQRRYAPLTLENVVREMKGNIRGGEGYNYGAGNIRAAVTPQFRNLEQLQAARGKIITEKEFEPHKEEANKMLFELADKFHPYSKYSNSGFGHAQTFSETLADIGRGKHSAWSQDYEPLPPELKTEAMGYLSHLKNMPTEYFEAKPQRAVNFGEFSGAVVPEELMKEYAPRLKNLGVREVVPFNPELTGSQQKALREFSGMHFNEGGSVINNALDVVYGLPRAAEAETSA